QSGPVVLAFVSFLVFWRLMQGGQQHARAIREGDRLTALGRAAEALTAYEAAVQRAPKNALGPSTVGITKTLLWQPDAALTPSLELAASVGGITPSAVEHEALGKTGARRSLQEVPAGASDPRLTVLVEAVLMARAKDSRAVETAHAVEHAKQPPGVGSRADLR
ncbi:MAG: hypothetical protein JNM69_02910, partial [Archangium sp.]|nr:hypothetical protein [Archangium sp.]